MIETLTFYLFAFILIFSAVAVISMRNPVHSVLFLILGFFNASGLFILIGAEFVAMILAIVYVGAVAVLFLFVVMMLDVRFNDLRKGAMQYVPLGLIIGAVLLAEFIYLFSGWVLPDNTNEILVSGMTNTQEIGHILYTDYVFPFQLAGLILFVAMIGAIVLTHRKRAGVLRQNIKEQVTRTKKDAIEIKKVASGTGV
ncbi:MAG: NADH:ubiquinone oxidoreductase subunit J [Micavibrio sp.]|nr:NADH:ubiquinone oxidoreductase subunit J [Micavibrio sp.]